MADIRQIYIDLLNDYDPYGQDEEENLEILNKNSLNDMLYNLCCIVTLNFDGYYMVTGNKAWFYRTDAQKKTKAVIHAFIDTIGTHRNVSADLIERCKKDKATIEDFKRRLTPATIEKKELPTITFYTITGSNFTANYPENDFTDEVFVF